MHYAAVTFVGGFYGYLPAPNATGQVQEYAGNRRSTYYITLFETDGFFAPWGALWKLKQPIK